MRFQLQAKIIAWMEIVFSTAFLCLMIFMLFVVISNPKEFQTELENQAATVGANEDERVMEKYQSFIHGSALKKFLYLAPALCYLVAEVMLGVLLLNAAATLNYKKLRLWYIITITLTGVMGVLMIPVLLVPTSGVSLLLILTSALFTLYSLWVVHSLRNEIKGRPYGAQGSPPPVYQASFTNSNYYPGPTSDKEFLKI